MIVLGCSLLLYSLLSTFDFLCLIFFISVYNFEILSNSFMLITNRIITWNRICCMLLFISHT